MIGAKFKNKRVT